MRNSSIYTIMAFVVVIGLVALAVLLPAIRAYSSNQSITCNRSLVTLLLVAEQEYGFESTLIDLAELNRNNVPERINAEDPVCRSLRQELDAFLSDVLRRPSAGLHAGTDSGVNYDG